MQIATLARRASVQLHPVRYWTHLVKPGRVVREPLGSEPVRASVTGGVTALESALPQREFRMWCGVRSRIFACRFFLPAHEARQRRHTLPGPSAMHRAPHSVLERCTHGRR